jgi:hypothetical protein
MAQCDVSKESSINPLFSLLYDLGNTLRVVGNPIPNLGALLAGNSVSNLIDFTRDFCKPMNRQREGGRSKEVIRVIVRDIEARYRLVECSRKRYNFLCEVESVLGIDYQKLTR